MYMIETHLARYNGTLNEPQEIKYYLTIAYINIHGADGILNEAQKSNNI